MGRGRKNITVVADISESTVIDEGDAVAEKAFHKNTPFAVLFSRTNGALKPRTPAHIQAEFEKHGIRAFMTQVHEREAYRAIFSFGGRLETLDSTQVGNLDKAITNVREFAAEVAANG